MSFTGMTPEQAIGYKKNLDKGGRVLDSNPARDCWGTNQTVADRLIDEFNLQIDAAADSTNSKLPLYFGPDHYDPRVRDSLVIDWLDFATLWGVAPRFWLNPPYSIVGKFMKVAYETSKNGGTVVALVSPSLSSKWWSTWVLPAITPHDQWIETYENMLRPESERRRGEGRGFTRGFERRLQFDPPAGIKASTNSRDSVLVVLFPPS